MVDNIIKQYLFNKNYNRGEAQLWCDNINDKIMKSLRQQPRGFKYIIHSTIFKKGEASLHFSNNFLWNQITDGSIFVKYENATLKCFVSLFVIAQEKKNLHYHSDLIN